MSNNITNFETNEAILNFIKEHIDELRVIPCHDRMRAICTILPWTGYIEVMTEIRQMNFNTGSYIRTDYIYIYNDTTKEFTQLSGRNEYYKIILEKFIKEVPSNNAIEAVSENMENIKKVKEMFHK